jgi:hypothetical protein
MSCSQAEEMNDLSDINFKRIFYLWVIFLKILPSCYWLKVFFPSSPRITQMSTIGNLSSDFRRWIAKYLKHIIKIALLLIVNWDYIVTEALEIRIPTRNTMPGMVPLKSPDTRRKTIPSSGNWGAQVGLPVYTYCVFYHCDGQGGHR